ncbi:MAG TPA: Hpt domain-containing protein, partial [Alphaproteobacteria bacterium]|nr:Hpt domain-containing protein [Alphaproteobacteria bacterium]
DLSVIAALFGGIDDEALATLDEFVAVTVPRIERIGAALAAGDLNEARHWAHTTAGAAASVGAAALAEQCLRLEGACRDGEGGLAPALLRQTRTALSSVEAAIRALHAG